MADSPTISLPGRDQPLTLSAPAWPATAAPPSSRRVLAAPHVAARGDGAIDWDATLRFRRHLWSLGFGVADAMDTAQRGMGLSWPQTRELITRSAREAHCVDGLLACGAGTDQLNGAATHRLTVVRDAYLAQVAVVEASGARVILMASRALAKAARGADDYESVYDDVLSQTCQPVILHWLGEMFDPALAGYWGSGDLDKAEETLLRIITAHRGRIDGVKMSLLDADREIRFRRRLPAGVRLYTGDDFNYPELIRGDGHGHSEALLGVFSAIAPPASAALHALDAGDLQRYDAVFAPTVPLARHIFEAPTYYYKTGIAFLAWLNGHQSEFTMLDGLQHRRSAEHLATLVELADAAGALIAPDLAAARAHELFDRIGATP